jgi:autotransporter-associated beta strand protein
MSIRVTAPRVARALVVVLSLAAAGPAAAQTPTNTFTPNTPTAVPYLYSWSAGANWDVPPAPGGSLDSVLQFNATGTQSYNAVNDLTGTCQMNGLLFDSTSSGVTVLSGNALNFTTSSTSALPVLSQNGSGAAVVNNTLTATNLLTLGGTGTGALVLNGNVTNTGGLAFANAGAVYQGALGVVSGGGAFTKSGSGTLYLFGANTFTASTIQVSGGALAVIGPGGTSDSAALGAAGARTVALTNNATFAILSGQFDPNSGTKAFNIGSGGGTFDVGFGGQFTLNALNQLTGSGNLTKTGLGTLLLGSDYSTGATPFTGAAINVNAGTLQIATQVGAAGSASTVVVNGGTLDLQISAFPRPIDLTGDGLRGVGALVNSTSTAVSNASTITSSGGLATFGGAGTGGLTLTGNVTTAGIAKYGTNTVTLQPGAASTVSITGPTTVNGGVLGLDFTNNNNPILPSDQAVNLAATGKLSLTGNGTAPTTQTVGGLVLNPGQGTVTVVSGNNQNATLNLGTVTPNPGGTVSFVTTNTGTGVAAVTVANPNTAGGILGGWALFGTNTFAAVSGGAVVSAGNGTANTYATAVNTDVTAAYPVAAPAGFTTHSLRFNTAPAASPNNTFTLSGTNTVESGGVLIGTGVTTNALVITGGNLVTPAGAGQPNLFVHQSGAVDVTIGSVIGTSTNTGFGITKDFGGRLILTNTNLFTGGVYIAGGIVRATAARSLGASTGVVTLASGAATLELLNDAATNFGNPVVINSVVAPGANSATINVNRNTSTTATGLTHQLGSLTIGNQQLQTTGSNSFALNFSGTTTLKGNPTFFVNTANLTLTGVIAEDVGTNTYGFTKSGGATLFLPGANTFKGGVITTAGTIQVQASDTVTSGALVGGPLGTGTLTLSGGTIQDNGAARTLHNGVAVIASSTFSSSGTGSLTFTDAGLSAPTTFDIRTNNPTLTVTNTTTISQVVTGPGFTKAGAGTLVLAKDDLYTGATAISAGVVQFNTPGSIGGVGASVTPASGGTAAAGYAIDQGFLSRIASGSAGVVALAANSTAPLDFSAAGANLTAASLGATGAFTYSGALTPNGTTYRLGGGGGTLTVSSALTGAGNALTVTGNGTTGVVAPTNAANEFTGITLNTGGVLLFTGADGAAGDATSLLGAVPAAPAANLTFTGGTLRYGSAATALNVNRSIVLNTGGGSIDTNGFNISLANAITGTGGFTKVGTGSLTVTNPLPNGPVSVVGATTTAASTLNLAGNDLTATSLTLTGVVNQATSAPAPSPNPTTYFAVLTNVSNLTVNGPVTLGSDSPAVVTINPGGSVNFAAGANDIRIGYRTVAAPNANGILYPVLLDASQATSVTLSGANVVLGGTPGNSGLVDGDQSGTLILPRSAAGTTTITAATVVQVGGGSNQGSYFAGKLLGGSGSLTVTTPFLNIGAQKTLAVLAFNDGNYTTNAGPATFYPGGTFSLSGPGGTRVAVDAGRNVAPNTSGTNNTGSTTLDIFDTTGATLTGPGGAAQIAAVRLGYYNSGTSGTGAGAGTGVFVLDGASSRADIAGPITLGTFVSTNGTAPAQTKGVFVVNNGVARLSGANGIVLGATTSSNQVSVFGGTLDLNNNPVGALNGLPAVTVTGSTGPLGTAGGPGLNVTGGTLLNAGAVGTTGANFNHSGGTVSRTVAGTTAIAGAYNVTSTAPSALIAANGNATGNFTTLAGTPAVGGATLNLDSTAAGGTVAVTAASLARSGTGTLNVIPVAGSLGTNETVTFTTSPAVVATSNGNMVPVYAVAQANGTTNTAGTYLTHGANGLVPLTYSTLTDINAAGPTDVFDTTAAQSLGAAVNLLALRSSAAVDLNGNTLTVGTGASGPAGVLLNGGSVVSSTGGPGALVFGGREAVIYAGSGTTSVIAVPITGTGGLTFFGSAATGSVAAGRLSVTADNSATLAAGTVTINGGVFAANNTTGSATGAAGVPVKVGAGGTLAGAGSVAGAVTVGRFGTVAPGDGGVGTLTVGGNTTFTRESALAVGVGPSGTNNTLAVTGATTTVNLQSGTILALTNSGGFDNTAAASYSVVAMPAGGGGRIQVNGTATAANQLLGTYAQGAGSDLTLPVTIQPQIGGTSGFALNPGDTFTLSRVGDAAVLSFTPAAVPEPATVGLVAAAALGLAGAARRRRKFAGAAARGDTPQ